MENRLDNIGYTVNYALISVLEERVRQEAKWGEQNHHPYKWLAILGEEIGEFCEAMLDSENSNYAREEVLHAREELVQTAAVALSMLECFDRNNPGIADDL